MKHACRRVACSKGNSSRTSMFYHSSWSLFSLTCAVHHHRQPAHKTKCNQQVSQSPADTALYGYHSSRCCTFQCCRSRRSRKCFNRSMLKYCSAFNSLPPNLFAEFSGQGEALECHQRFLEGVQRAVWPRATGEGQCLSVLEHRWPRTSCAVKVRQQAGTPMMTMPSLGSHGYFSH